MRAAARRRDPLRLPLDPQRASRSCSTARCPDFNVGTNEGASCAPRVEASVMHVCRAADRPQLRANGRFKGGWTTRHYGRPEDGVHADPDGAGAVDLPRRRGAALGLRPRPRPSACATHLARHPRNPGRRWPPTSEPSHDRPAQEHPRRLPAHRPRDHRQVLADRGADADADEQPAPRRRREPARARRLRRHRPRRAHLGRLRPHRRDPEDARGRRDPARPVRQAGRRLPHPRRRAARADRQLEPGAALGDLGPLQRARSQGPDDVRPDDRRLLDLHRLARASCRAPTRPSPRPAASTTAATSRAAGS